MPLRDEAAATSTPAFRSSCSRSAARRSASFLALPVSSRPWRLASARRAARSALRCSLSTARRSSSFAAFLAASSSCVQDPLSHLLGQRSMECCEALSTRDSAGKAVQWFWMLIKA